MDNFLGKFLLRKKLKAQKPGAQPVDGSWEKSIMEYDGKLVIWYSLALVGQKNRTHGAMME